MKVLRNLYPEAFTEQLIDVDMLHAALGIPKENPTEGDPGIEDQEGVSEWLIPWIERRIFQNRNANLVFVGDTGSGKSYASVSLAEQIDQNFSVEHIVFTTKDFISLVNSDLPKGSVVIFDDAGLGIPAREWQRTSAKIFGKLFQGFRYKNLISMITVPDISFIERQSRMLMHLYFEATDTQGIMKPFHPFHPYRGDDRLGFKYPTMQRSGREIQVRTTLFPLPSKKLADEYEAKKFEYMEGTNKAFQLELEYTEMLEKKAQEEMQKRIRKMEEAGEENRKKDEKRKKAIEMKNDGYSEREIAKEIGMGKSWVHKTVGNAWASADPAVR
jgi:ABC-type dipeptide/oligopeptide/nickel transport system ATPase component